MAEPSGFRIDTTEHFQHLPSAPIAEAVVEIRARATSDWNEAGVSAVLYPRLAEYPHRESRKEMQVEMKVVPSKPPVQEYRDLGWKGFVVRSGDKKQVVQFTRDGFVFSRLQPYLDWQHLRDEALRLWDIHKELARPVEVGQIGLRYINRIPLSPIERDFSRFIQPVPEPPCGIGLAVRSFMHIDELAVPGHPYVVKLVKTIQDVPEQGVSKCYLILDIDVLAREKAGLDEPPKRLEEMRWLKNKVFFCSITEKALRMFGGGQ
jgi:uncharacterized protein (TIGR04255 family)